FLSSAVSLPVSGFAIFRIAAVSGWLSFLLLSLSFSAFSPLFFAFSLPYFSPFAIFLQLCVFRGGFSTDPFAWRSVAVLFAFLQDAVELWPLFVSAFLLFSQESLVFFVPWRKFPLPTPSLLIPFFS